MSTITVQAHQMLERILSLEIVRVTERAAVSAARLRGRGNEKAADQAAVDAMRRELNKLPIHGTVVIGEGERDEAPMLFIGEEVGRKTGPKVDIAVDPLEGTTLCAKNMPGAIATMAMAEGGTLLNAPDVYMEKIAIGPGYSKGVVDLDAPAEQNIRNLAKAKGVTAGRHHGADHGPAAPRRPDRGGAQDRRVGRADHRRRRRGRDPHHRSGRDRHRHLYRHRRRAGGRAGGCGAALHRRPDAVPAGARHRGEARARRSRWASRTRARNTRSRTWCSGDCLFAATGVTTGSMLKGVKFRDDVIETETVVMRSVTGTVRWIRAEHRQLDKFHLD